MELDAIFDSTQTTENYHVSQQAQKPHNIYSMVDLSMHTHFSDEVFLNNFNPQPNTFEQSSIFSIPEQWSIEESARNVQTTPASPMGPPARPRKRKAPTLRADDWEPVKSRILELHITQGLPLPKVKKNIEDEFGFVAKLRQYRTRISQWGKDKNIKSHEMSAIVRKRQHRKLFEVHKGELTFKVRGAPVEPQKIERWMKRNDVPESLPYAPSPTASTPSAIACRTISECGSPAADLECSPMAPNLSPGTAHNLASSSRSSSPALSISSIVRPQNTSFTGASPAPMYRPLPGNIFLAMSGSQINVGLAAPYRYMQDEEERLRRELSMEELIHGIGHVKTLDILHNLGGLLIDQGRYKSAEILIRRELESRQLIYGNEFPSTICALDALGAVLKLQGHYAQAEKIHRRTFASRKTIFGMAHPNTLESMHRVGSVLPYLGRAVEAEKILEETLILRTELLGEKHSDTVQTLNNLALVYKEQGRLAEAVQMYNKTLSIVRKLRGIENPITLGAMMNLALVLSSQGEYKKAEKILEEQLAVCEIILGREHPRMLISLGCLAFIYRGQGRLQEAEDLSLQVLETRKRVLGERHPETLNGSTNLASIYESQGRWAEAVELRLQVQRMKEDL